MTTTTAPYVELSNTPELPATGAGLDTAIVGGSLLAAGIAITLATRKTNR